MTGVVIVVIRQKLTDFFIKDLKIEKFPMIAITGSGGKTSLMFTLVDLLRDKGRAVATTTAKLAVADVDGCGELFIGSAERVKEKLDSLPRPAAVTVVRKQSGVKLCGFTPDEVNVILKYGAADWIIVEADGSFGMPFKLYEEWEPPVPELAVLQFIVVGADAFKQPLSDKTVFRSELLGKRFGARFGETSSLHTAVMILSSRTEYLKNSPKQARRVLFLNKADLLGRTRLQELVLGLSEATGYDMLLVASLQRNIIYEAISLTSEKVVNE